MRKHIYCFAHKQMMEARALALRLPPPEDANAIHMSLMQVQKALIDGKISAKTAGLLLYSLQLAMTNVGQTTFGQAADDELLTDLVDEEEALREKALSTQQSAISQKQELITAKDAEDAKEEKGLPRIDNDLPRIGADERGSGMGLPLIDTDVTDRKDVVRVCANERGLETEEGSKVVTMRM